MPIYAGGGTAGSVRVTLSVYNSAGALEDGGNVAATVTLPDGTTSSPTVTRDAEGEYHFDYYPTTPGVHGVLWVVTGLNAGSLEESFNVDDARIAPVVSLSEVKARINMAQTQVTSDDELRLFLAAAQAAIEARVGPLTRRTVTETHSGGSYAVVLGKPPVVSVTSVTENGSAVAASGYSLAPFAGVLTRVSGYSRSAWSDGFGNVSVTYVGGRTTIPEDLRRAVLEMVAHLWETQRGQQRGPRSGDDYTPGIGYSLPNRVKELTGPYELPGIA